MKTIFEKRSDSQPQGFGTFKQYSYRDIRKFLFLFRHFFTLWLEIYTPWDPGKISIHRRMMRRSIFNSPAADRE